MSREEERERESYIYVTLKSCRGQLATDIVILNRGQVTKMTPELPSPLLTGPALAVSPPRTKMENAAHLFKANTDN
ncbi:hypothetical protein TNCV_425291 [Trichonephila clavipes]|nr:hypothetical protein TNCV_425291 [Trichonephila clavipes]